MKRYLLVVCLALTGCDEDFIDYVPTCDQQYRQGQVVNLSGHEALVVATYGDDMTVEYKGFHQKVNYHCPRMVKP